MSEFWAWLLTVWQPRWRRSVAEDETLTKAAQEQAKAASMLYDAHPEMPYKPKTWVSISGRAKDGRILSERVDLDNYSLGDISIEQRPLRWRLTARWRDLMPDRIDVAHSALEFRLGKANEAFDARHASPFVVRRGIVVPRSAKESKR